MVEALDVAAPIIAIVAGYALYFKLGRSNLGADDDWWEGIRRGVLPQLNRFARRRGFGYAAYHLSPAEYAGRLELPAERVERLLEDTGFERMPLAAFKYAPDDRPEVGSWAFREEGPLIAGRQDHVMLFEAEGATDLFAHNEFNAFNPFTATLHYLGIDIDVALGVSRVRQRLLEQTGWEVERPDRGRGGA